MGTAVCIYLTTRTSDIAQLISAGILPVLVANFFACGSDHSEEDSGPRSNQDHLFSNDDFASLGASSLCVHFA